MGLALAREKLSVEVEEGIRKCKSVQEFVEKNRNNEKVINEYKESIQPPIDAINQAISQGEYAGKKIKIGRIAEKEYLNQVMYNLQSILTFLP